MAESVTRDSNQFAQMQIHAAAAPAQADAEALLSELQNLAHRLRQILRTEAPGGPAPATREVLEALRTEGPRTVPQLARLRGTSRQNIQIIVNRLEKEGWVRSIPNLAHKRSDLVAATPKAESFLASASNPEEKIAALLAGEVSAADLATGLQLFKQLKQLFNKNPAATDQSAILPASSRTSTKPRRRSVAKSIWQTEENELPVNLL